MRPVNLIPAEDRRGDQAPLRTGPLAYIVMGALVAVLVGVAALALTGNQISERQDEVATLKREDAAVSAHAARLASYTQFRALSEQRVATVQSLADSRFDWERVLRELSLVLPSDVALTELSANGAGGEGAESSEGGGGGLAVSGPSLTLSGCAAGYAGVAGFVTALKDIDGVTRVGVQSSSETAESSGSGEVACGGGSATVEFALVVAFDAAPVPAPEGEAGATLEAAPEAAQAASSETSESSGEEAEGG
jgi:Tfp pilus assembly protein PilN